MPYLRSKSGFTKAVSIYERKIFSSNFGENLASQVTKNELTRVVFQSPWSFVRGATEQMQFPSKSIVKWPATTFPRHSHFANRLDFLSLRQVLLVITWNRCRNHGCSLDCFESAMEIHSAAQSRLAKLSFQKTSAVFPSPSIP